MANYNLDNSISFEGVVPNNRQANDEGETKVVGSDLGARLGVTPNTNYSNVDNTTVGYVPPAYNTPVANVVPNTPTAPEQTVSNDEYDGPGLIIDIADMNTEQETPKYTGITPDTQKHIDDYLANMDLEIAEAQAAKEAQEAAEAEKVAEETNDKEDDLDEDGNDIHFNEKYESATVVIDKTNFGSVINFTEEERAKLEKARKIKLEEVETLSLNSLKTKKAKKRADLNRVIKKKADFNVTNIVLPISGYTATVSGCSAYELISLIEPTTENLLLRNQTKWSVIHSKIESTSIGDMDFNTFLQNTAVNDYETLIYGILCSTYPDDDKIELTCEKCGKNFEHNYSVRSLIRVEKMSEELQNTVMRIVDASAFEGSAKETHENAMISTVKRIKLPMSEIIIDIHVQSAYDLIKDRAEELAELKDEKYQPAAVLSTIIRSAYIYDEEDDTYFEVDDAIDLAHLVYSLSEVDVMLINKIADEMLNGKTIEYGLMDINCPHCGQHTDSISIGLDEMLFIRYRQAVSTTVE